MTSSAQKDNTSASCGSSVSEDDLMNNETNPELSYSCCIIVRSNIDFSGSRLLYFRNNYPINLGAPCVNETAVTVCWQHYFIISLSEDYFYIFFLSVTHIRDISLWEIIFIFYLLSIVKMTKINYGALNIFRIYENVFKWSTRKHVAALRVTNFT